MTEDDYIYAVALGRVAAMQGILSKLMPNPCVHLSEVQEMASMLEKWESALSAKIRIMGVGDG